MTMTSSFQPSWLTSRETVGIGGGIAALQAHLVRPHVVELQEELRIQLEPAATGRIQLGQPAAHTIRIKLLIPCPVQGIGDVNPASVAAHLDHLRASIERYARARCVRLPAYDAAALHRTGLNRI